MKSTLFRLFALLVVISMIVAPVSAQSNTQGDAPQRPTPPLRSGDLKPAEFSPKSSTLGELTQELVINEIEGANEPARYIIVLAEKPLATYAGDINGLQATSPAVTGAKLDVKSAASTAYVNYLKAQQTKYLANVAATLGYAPKVNFQYQYATNGVSLTITPAEAAKLAAQEGVKVYRAPIETPDTDEGPILIGAPAIWNGDTFDKSATKGEDIIVGIIDTGINFDHPSFAQTSTVDPYVYPDAAKFFGVCDSTNVDQYDLAYANACNDKLIGAFTYVKDEPIESESPEDSEGHGSHTASTVAGNWIDIEYQGVATTIHGVAPHARIISFDVCVPEPPNGACFGDATVAAVDDALITGVNVINYSISGGSTPYSDPVELAFLSATEAGIFVSTSAGNSGDTTGESSVAHRSPWVSTVAAATHSRIFASAVDITGPGTVPAELIGMGAVQSGPVITADLLNLPIKYSTTNLNGCAAFDANFFDGAIALIQRGVCAFAVKEANAYAAGAEYVFIYNSRTGPPVGMSGIVTGAAMLSLEEGTAVKNWIDANPTATASMYADVSKIVNPAWEDIIAAFSSYGPNTTFDVLKPDITGPGVNILAAVADDTITPSGDYELELYQGTSMSSPHNAGAAALVMSLHPDWTPSQVKSAMMLTADDGMLADRSAWDEGVRPATPQDEGAGRISLADTALVGLTLDESIVNYEAADPALGGDPTTLNLASLYSSKCVGGCSWTRTFTSVATAPATYTVEAPTWISVSPAEFTVNPGATQEITITADVSELTPDEWAFAQVSINTDSFMPNPFHTVFLPIIKTGVGGTNAPAGVNQGIPDWADLPISDVHIPVAVMPSISNIPEWVMFETHRDAGADTIDNLEAVEITDGNVYLSGLTKANLDTFVLDPDPTNGDPIDDISQVYVKTLVVPAYSIRVVAEITATSANDLDMFLYYDLDGDGVLTADDYLVTSSATGAALEYINAPKGWIYYNLVDTYFIVVQNWAGAADDTVTLATGIVPLSPDNGNYDVTVPATNPALAPFSIEVAWDEDTEDGDRLYGYFETCADTLCENWIGATDLDIRRGADDVVKTADVETASPGDVITYTIAINNYFEDDSTYTIADDIPVGTSYVADSVTGGAVFDAVNNRITWSGTVKGSTPSYVMTTSLTDENCTNPFGDQEYVDLKTLGLDPSVGIFGDDITWQYTTLGLGSEFYGSVIPTLPRFTDDGYILMDSTQVAFAAEGAPIPTSAAPNALVAPFWTDFKIVYDLATTRGVSAASWLTGGLWLVEFDDVEKVDDPNTRLDYEVFYWREADPTLGTGSDITFIYDNLSSTTGYDFSLPVIGVEDFAGETGSEFLTAPGDDLLVCYDWAATSEPQIITFQVMVDDDAVDGELLNIALHDTDLLGAEEETAEASVDLNVFSVTNLDLRQSTDPLAAKPWTIVPGDFVGGFTLSLNTTVPYYYLDTDTITANYALANGYHEFFVDTTPAGFFAYWDAKGVNAGADPLTWQGVMWKIINGDEPIFILKVTGTDYTLVDGFTFAMGGGDTPLRINGDYLVGAYTFTGDVTDAFGYNADTLNVGITFTAP